MRTHSIDVRALFLVGLLAILLGDCSASPDGNSIGNCQLSCTDGKIAPSNAKIRFLGGDIKTACEGIASGTDYPSSIPVQFVIEQANPPPSLPASTIPGSTNTTDTSTAPIPLAGVYFEPLILAGLMASNPDDPNGPAKYKGIFTPQDQWCTDSCGVGLVEIVPLCFGTTNTVSLQIHSGAAAAVSTITVSP